MRLTTHQRAPHASGLQNPSVVDVLNHEIRTPLAILMGHAEILEDLALEDQAAHSVTAIAAAAARLAKVADALSRIADSDGVEAEFLRIRSSPQPG